MGVVGSAPDDDVHQVGQAVVLADFWIEHFAASLIKDHLDHVECAGMVTARLWAEHHSTLLDLCMDRGMREFECLARVHHHGCIVSDDDRRSKDVEQDLDTCMLHPNI